MTKYSYQEDLLFLEWQARIFENEPDADFVPDGMLYRGEIEFNKEGLGYIRGVGDAAARWDRAEKRIVIITKDLYDDEVWDIRVETGRDSNTGQFTVKTDNRRIMHNLTLWSHALLNSSAGNPILDYDMTPTWDELREFYESAPIVRMNCKKTLGERECKNTVLHAHLKTYADLILRQISLYDADIILCCGGSSAIKNFVKKYYLQDLERITSDGWMNYSPSTNKLVVDSYHPSARSSPRTIYEPMMKDMSAFLVKYPEFIKPHR